MDPTSIHHHDSIAQNLNLSFYLYLSMVMYVITHGKLYSLLRVYDMVIFISVSHIVIFIMLSQEVKMVRKD